MGRKRAFPWRWRIGALALLAAIGVGGYVWWQGQHWMPDRAQFPVQGVLIGAADGPVKFAALRAIHANFAYLEASKGGRGRDAAFARNLAEVRASGLPFGAVHAYDPCIPAEQQAANFVTTVPRDMEQLPPVIALEKLASDCPDPLSETAVESELTTFLNQVEGHVGQPVVLKISPEFEAQYGVSSQIERNLWLSKNFQQPDYGGRPWTLWTANAALRTEISDLPLRWVAVQP